MRIDLRAQRPELRPIGFEQQALLPRFPAQSLLAQPQVVEQEGIRLGQRREQGDILAEEPRSLDPRVDRDQADLLAMQPDCRLHASTGVLARWQGIGIKQNLCLGLEDLAQAPLRVEG